MSILKNTVLPIHYPISLTRINYFKKSKTSTGSLSLSMDLCAKAAQPEHNSK